MNSKISTALASALLVVVAGANAGTGNITGAGGADLRATAAAPNGATRFNRSDLRAAAPAVVPKRAAKRAYFKPEKDLPGEHLYIIQLEGAPLATYRGGIAGLAATSLEGDRNGLRAKENVDARGAFDTQSAASLAYRSYLEDKQADFQSKLGASIGRAAYQAYSHTTAFNGMTLRLTQAEAAAAASLPGVRSVTRDRLDKIETASSPAMIGAGRVWDGSGTGLEGSMGEGLIVGIIDSGMNYTHPSFAEVGDDGYVHINPFGDNTYVGDCNRYPGICNNKLIGGFAFLEAFGNVDPLTQPGDPFSKDTDGHGSHVGSTAAGNFVIDPPFLDVFGNDTGATLGTISGVAPHANLINLKVCAPSCGAADRVAAVDKALELGINVLNHSIGTGSGSPWAEPVAIAFLNARAAGILVNNSAGNSGPTPGTVDGGGNGPWVTAVAASTHDREIPDKFLQDMSGGDTTPPATISGKSFSPGITGSIVWAGDYSNGDPNPEQCLNPFPTGTWTNDEIVLCERGAIARVEKCINIQAGGAAGCILTNVPGGATSVVADPYVIPGIHIDVDSGGVLKAWLASGSGHAGTITAAEDPVINPAAGDWLADFSSRGPYPGFNFLSPSISAPGVEVFAAGADLQFENPDASVAGAYGSIGGTSMSSPHMAGSSTLLLSVRPDWTAAEILSAFMTTATTAMVKEDGVTTADPFDYGGGRVQIDVAARAGLLLDETAANFEAANPTFGGDPRTLNVAALYDGECLQGCSWERTLRATVAGTWEASFTARDPGLGISVEPSSFTLDEGQLQTITVSADVSALPIDAWAFGEVVLTPSATRGGLETPATVLQTVVKGTSGILPGEINVDAGRNAGSVLVGGFRGIPITDLQIQAFGLDQGTATDVSITGEFPEFDPYQGIAVATTLFDVPDGSARVVVFTSDSTAPDVDLFVGRDDNGDGEISADEERCNSGTSGSEEFCELTNPEPGTYWATVLQFTASAPDATDTTTLTTSAAAPSTGNLMVTGPSSVPGGEPYELRVFWDDEMKEGDVFFGAVTLGSDAANRDNIGTIPINLIRGRDDVQYSVDSSSAEPGDTLTFTVEVAANFTPEDLAYDIDATIPDGFTLVPGSVTGGGSDDGDSVSWSVLQESLSDLVREYTMTTSNDDPLCDTGFGGYVDLEELGIFPDGGISGDSSTWSAFAGQNINFYGEQTSGMNFTDDGFAFFASTPGAQPWVNEPIPNASEPNDMAAIFWNDWEIVYDAATNRGVTLATAGADLSLLEYDDVEPWPAGETSARYDFQLVILGVVDDAPGAYEVVMAYDNLITARVDHGVTAGVEDLTGTSGTQYAYNELEKFTPGLMVCYDFIGPSVEPVVLSYQVTVDADASGGDAVSVLTNTVDNPGSTEVSVDLAVFVEGLTDTDGDGILDGDDNCVLVPNADQRDTDSDGFGNICDGDFNQDGVVNWLDLGYMRINFFSGDPDADLDGDGKVNASDLGIMKGLFYAPPGPSGVAGN